MKHDDAVKSLKLAQESEEDMRENSKECVLFVDKRDGQWEQRVIDLLDGKPRYTDDQVTPIVKQIAGELTQAKFTPKVKPDGDGATKDIARIYNGLINTIFNRSSFDEIKKHAAKQLLKAGIAGWEVDHDYEDDRSFDQELTIKPIYNYLDRVWVDPYSLEQDNSDANWWIILDHISKDEYYNRFPDGECRPIGSSSSDDYEHKPDFITIGRMYYKKSETKKLIELSDGSIVDDATDLPEGITEVRSREITSNKVYKRYFDGGGYLNEEEETAFTSCNVISVYANYSVSEGKRLYFGAVEKLLDLQRTHNYSFSREIEGK